MRFDNLRLNFVTLAMIVGVLAAATAGRAATFVVTNTTDSGAGSLRAAILAANQAAGADLVRFAIPGAGPHTIQPLSPLPAITDTATLNGYTQPGSRVNSLAVGNNAVLKIMLDGRSAGANAIGLEVRATNSRVEGLVVGGFSSDGVRITTPDISGNATNTVSGCFIGTNATATAALPNGGAGVNLQATSGNIVGGTAAAARNIISGNGSHGVYVYIGPPPFINPVRNVVANNYIGTDANGTARIANGGDGLAIIDGFANTIGGTSAPARNVISGNSGNGVSIRGAETGDNLIYGNYIGLDATGQKGLGNALNGVLLNAWDDIIGSTIQGARNVISGNGGNGVHLDGRTSRADAPVSGNFIGTDASGKVGIGNGGAGVRLSGPATPSPDFIIGRAAIVRNVVSANQIGIVVQMPGYQNSIQENFIGTDATGKAGLGNRTDGIVLEGGSGPNPDARTSVSGNVIAANRGNGVVLRNTGTTQDFVVVNKIGVGTDGQTPLGNGGAGISITNAPASVIGATVFADTGPRADPPALQLTTQLRNTIAYNGGDGIRVLAGRGNRLLSNSIFSNDELGIDLDNDGVSANEPLPPGSGATDRLNPPELLTATSGTGTDVTFRFSGAPATLYLFEFFANRAVDPSGYGEGQLASGYVTATTDSAGNVTASARLQEAPVGHFISATATDLSASMFSTSEFSRCIRVSPERTPPVVSFVTPTDNTVTNNLLLVRGLAADPFPGAGIARVDLIIVRRSDGKYWDGTEWVANAIRLTTVVQGTTWFRDRALPGPLENGLYTLMAVAIDRAGNAASTAIDIIADRQAPAVTITSPVNGEELFFLSSIRGTAIDTLDAQGRAGTGVRRVDIFIVRRGDNRYWDGQTWVATPTPLPATLQGTSWYRNDGLPANSDLLPGLYTIQAIGYDAAGNRGVSIINVTVPRSQ